MAVFACRALPTTKTETAGGRPATRHVHLPVLHLPVLPVFPVPLATRKDEILQSVSDVICRFPNPKPEVIQFTQSNNIEAAARWKSTRGNLFADLRCEGLWNLLSA